MKKIILAISIFSLLLSCSKDDAPIIEPEKPVNFYATGAGYPVSGYTRAVLWENGIATYLTDGSYEAYGNSICVDQGNTYVVGVDNSTAKYWKNGVLQDLGITTSSFFTKVQVVDNKVYILGKQGSDIKLWEDGVPTTITGFSNSSYPNDFKIVGNDIYILISENNNAVLWKNGTTTVLSDGIKLDISKDLCIVGNDVYVLAEEYYSGVKKIKYWKNGVVYYINNPSSNIFVSQIDVDNTDVFICGFMDNKAYYWKNNTAISVATANVNSYTFALDVLDNNVFSTIYENAKIRFMKNGTQLFEDNTHAYADPYDCFVVYK